jgi:hypothetical protein
MPTRTPEGDIMSRTDDLDRLYGLLDQLEDRLGGKRRLKNCTGRMNWPEHGVYFFFSPGEIRARASGEQLRVTRVGTHAVSEGSSQTLWDRLKQHYGTGSRSADHPHGGDQRGSVFRREVGRALIARHDLSDQYPEWDLRRIKSSDRERDVIRDEEYPLERWVSTYIRELPFLWVTVDDEPGKHSERAVIERNALGLLSNLERPALDPRPDWWLGTDSQQQKIRQSGLWNVRDVEVEYDPEFLDLLERRIDETEPL